MYVKLFQRLLLLCGALALISCGGDSNGSAPQQLLTVQGQAIGPLLAASVTVTDADGEVFGPVLTDSDGGFSIETTNPRSPLLVRSQGGQLNGIYPFQSELRTYCSAQDSDSTLTCNVTPYSSLIALLAEVEIGLGEPVQQAVAQAQQKVFAVFKLTQDPFVADSADPGSVQSYFFDLAEARNAINDNGTGLAGWLDDMADWVNAPFIGTAPAGTPVYRILLSKQNVEGSAGPVFVDVAMGETAQFMVTPDVNYDANVSGCGGELVGTTYTTAPIISASKTSGVCQVIVKFELEKFNVSYAAGPNGSVTGVLQQLIPYLGAATGVTAVAEEGFEFAQWSDGVLTAQRTDENISADLTVTAAFQRQQLTLTYLAGPGGTVSGDSVQNIFYDDDGIAVTAVANPGYEFDRWSDNYADAQRTEVKVKADKTITAQFVAKPDAIPWSQGLHGGDISIQIVGPTKAVVDWQDSGGTYNLYLTDNPETVLEQYALFNATLMTTVTAPQELDNLTAEQTLYVALTKDNAGVEELVGWTSLVPRSWGLDGDVFSQALDQDGNRFVGGNFTRAIQNIGGGVGLPSADVPLDTVHGLPFADVDGVVHAIVGDGAGGWYIGGQFSSVGGEPRVNLARIDRLGNVVLDWDGSVSGSGAVVKALARSAAGQLVVGGRFDFATGVGESPSAHKNIAVLNNTGELSDTFNATANGEVRAVLLSGDGVIVGGGFTTIGDGASAVPAGGLGLFSLVDGAVFDVGISVSGSVNVLKQVGSGFVIGGDFSSITVGDEPPKQQNLLAILGGGSQLVERTWNFTGPAGQAVNDVVIYDNRILVGGSFTGIDGTPHVGLIELDATADLLPSQLAVDGVVNALAVTGELNDRRIYVAGDFAHASGNGQPEQPRSAVAAFNSGGDLLDWHPDLAGTVKALALRKHTVDAGGVDEASYHTLIAVGDIQGISSATTRTRLAAFDDQGNLLPWSPAANDAVLALAINLDTVYVGGRFTQVGDQLADTDRDYLAAVDRNTGAVSSWDPTADGEVRTLLSEGGAIYAGGAFTQVSSLPRQNLAAIDLFGAALAWNPGANDGVDVLLADNGTIYAGGEFTMAGGASRSHLAAFDNSGALLGWNPSVNGRVHSLVAFNGDIYVGGDFIEAGTAPASRTYLAAFDALGDLLSWDPQADGIVRGLAQDQGVIYAVGDFVEVDAEARLGLAALDVSGAVLPWYPAEVTQAQSVQAAAGVIAVSGGFTRINGNAIAPRSGLVLFDHLGDLLVY